MTAAIYARISTKDKWQDTENHIYQLRDYCNRQGWTIVEEYVDHVTDTHADPNAFKRLFADASKRQFDVVVVWALDRFMQEGVYETFDYVQRLSINGIKFESYTEAHFRTTGPAGELMPVIAAWIAKQKRLRISEQTKAGMARARREGKHCGRPKRVFPRDEAMKLRTAGMSIRAIAKQLGVPLATVQRTVARVLVATLSSGENTALTGPAPGALH